MRMWMHLFFMCQFTRTTMSDNVVELPDSEGATTKCYENLKKTHTKAENVNICVGQCCPVSFVLCVREIAQSLNRRGVIAS